MHVRNARCASRQESGPESSHRRHREWVRLDPHRWRLSVVRWSIHNSSIRIFATALVKWSLSSLVIAPACLGSRVLSGEIMVSWHPRAWSLVALTVATLLVLLGALVAQVGRPYPRFFMAPDFRVFPSSPAAVAPGWGDRIVSVVG